MIAHSVGPTPPLTLFLFAENSFWRRRLELWITRKQDGNTLEAKFSDSSIDFEIKLFQF